MSYEFNLLKTNAQIYMHEYKRNRKYIFLKLAIHYTNLALSIRNDK